MGWRRAIRELRSHMVPAPSSSGSDGEPGRSLLTDYICQMF